MNTEDEEFARIEREIARRLAEQPALQEIEQYRLQMAAICTAAIGYWREGDGIQPDYDTVALRDVAQLYAKYERAMAAAQLVRADEREACANVCDHMAARCNDIRAAALESAAQNIRARSNT